MKKLSIIITLAVLITGCIPGNNPEPAPGKATLIAPAKDEICTVGNIVSPTESTVTLQWKEADNTESYEVTVKNLESGLKTTETTTNTQLPVTLTRGTPYSWNVISKSTKSTETATSDTWKFYNAGPAVTSYAPFPADILVPSPGQVITASGSVTLRWSGSDPDNDLVSYDVYFGTTAQPPLLKSGLTDQNLDVVTKSGDTYYWKIITFDAKGNQSDSGVFQFKVK